MQTPAKAALAAAATPATRDRYVDLLRALSILVVVAGHWLMAIVFVQNGQVKGASALDVVDGLWVATWVLQVMPIFFFVGGFSNFVAWTAHRRRGGPYVDFVRSRIARLMRPTLVFVLTWTMVALAIHLLAPHSLQTLRPALELLAKPLWFLAVYVLVVTLAPVMIRLHERFGARVPIALVALAAVVDVLRIAGGVAGVGYANFAFVWLFAHQLGFFYANGALMRRSRRWFVAAGALALGLLAALTALGPYSPSMVGMASDKASNNSPPTICLIVLTVWLVSLVMLARPAATAWVARPRAWLGVVVANSVIMTVFLWHLAALLLAAVVLLPLGFPQPPAGTAMWWALRPAWLIALATILAPLVALLVRYERPRAIAPRSRPAPFVIAGVVALVAGLAGLAQYGFDSPALDGGQALYASVALNALLALIGTRALVGSTSTRRN